MKKYLLALLVFFPFLISFILIRKLNKKIVFRKPTLALLLSLVSGFLWAQTPSHTFGSDGSLLVPAGVTQMTVQAWGGGGAGGGAGGAGVLTGRGGAGGGGGAYATASITILPGTTTLSVLVAAPVAGTTTGVGATGGTSTITGFENVIKAVGGAGGNANTSGGSPVGGAGGKASASFGTAVDGSNGQNGNTASLLVGLSSGSGGNGGNPGGGSGGAGLDALIFGNDVGNGGSPPGGGGGGATQSASAAAKSGGTGAAGQVIINYTCPTYNISTVTATAVCTTPGTSTITLTGSAASLPAGDYTVTYSLTNPAVNNLSIAMNVATAGTGGFTLSGLTAVGTRNITINRLTSRACFTDIGANTNIVTSAVTVGGTVTGGTPICNDSPSGTLSLTGNTGSVLSWESSVNPFNTWTPIANTTASYVSAPLTETTQFRAVVQNGGCAVERSISTTVTVNPLPQGSLTANGPLCGTGLPQLTFTATVGTGPYVIVYKENGGADRTATNITSGVAFTPFTSSVNSSITYTLVSIADANICTRSTGFTGGSATVTVNPKPSVPLVGTITHPTCLIATGSVQLTGLISPSAWTIVQTGTFNTTYSGSGTSFIVPNLAAGNYTFTIYETLSCPSSATTNVEIIASVTNTWNGSTWSKGSLPTNDTDVVQFSGNYQTIGNLKGCSCIVNSGVNVVVNSNHTLTIANAVSNNGGTLTFENNASLLQINSAVNTGNIVYKRNTTPVRRYDFTFWSSPVTRTPSFTLHDLSPDTLGDKYYKFDPVMGWIIIYNGAEAMETGRGYIIRAPQNYDITSSLVYGGSFTGVPNNGTFSIPLAVAEKSYLLGNPYPSAIYADQFIVDNTANLYGTLYFWTHNSPPSDQVAGDARYNYTTSDYAIYNLTGSLNVGSLVGTGATTPGNQNPPLGYIAAGQSFFVKSKTAQNAVFTNSMRVPGNNSQFFKTNTANKENATGHRVWLNLTNTQGAFKQILIGYVDGATNSWDNNYDGLTMNGNKYLDFYSINEFMKLVIQGRALPFVETDVVPLGYRSIIEGEFTIEIDHANGDLSTHDIYLEDKLTHLVHNLKNSNYTFNTAIGTFDDRFVLRYAKSVVLGTDEFNDPKQAVLLSVNNKAIKITSNKENITEVSIFDVTGKLVYSQNKINATELEISYLQSSNQVLFIKTTLENGYITSTKVVF